MLVLIAVLSLLGLIFAPSIMFSFLPNSNEMELGVTYWNAWSKSEVTDDLTQIKEVGFKMVRTFYYQESTVKNTLAHNVTKTFYRLIEELGLKVCLQLDWSVNEECLSTYLRWWGRNIILYQLFNELDMKKWSDDWNMPLMNDEVIGIIENLRDKILLADEDDDEKFLITFSMYFPARLDLVAQVSHLADYIGLDVYMDVGLTLFPHYLSVLRETTGKEVYITEFGSADSNDDEQSSFIIQGLNLFRNSGISQTWIYKWGENLHDIKGRKAETDIKNWIENN